MFALLAGFVPLIPGLIEAGLTTWDTVSKVRKLYEEDRSMTPEERAQLETMIAAVEARIDDTSKDV